MMKNPSKIKLMVATFNFRQIKNKQKMLTHVLDSLSQIPNEESVFFLCFLCSNKQKKKKSNESN